jgi:hypothetical protein
MTAVRPFVWRLRGYRAEPRCTFRLRENGAPTGHGTAPKAKQCSGPRFAFDEMMLDRPWNRPAGEAILE